MDSAQILVTGGGLALIAAVLVYFFGPMVGSSSKYHSRADGRPRR